MSLQTTTWQTAGPYFRIGLERLFQDDIARPGVQGERVSIHGRIVDGDGIPIPDAAIEIWQANAEGKYAHPADTQDKPLEQSFSGFARIPTDDQGFFRFTTIKPGSVPAPDGRPQARHLVVGVLMRGLLKGLVTRAYFPGEPLNAQDPVLNLIESTRRKTLILNQSPERKDLFTWEIHMQGEHETVFLDF
jgi:protocatechuate 3,4-dioxygenase alpha subunit